MCEILKSKIYSLLPVSTDSVITFVMVMAIVKNKNMKTWKDNVAIDEEKNGGKYALALPKL